MCTKSVPTSLLRSSSPWYRPRIHLFTIGPHKDFISPPGSRLMRNSVPMRIWAPELLPYCLALTKNCHARWPLSSDSFLMELITKCSLSSPPIQSCPWFPLARKHFLVFQSLSKKASSLPRYQLCFLSFLANSIYMCVHIRDYGLIYTFFH